MILGPHRPRAGRSLNEGRAKQTLWSMRGGWVLEADVSSFFGTLDHGQLRDLSRQRVVDGVVVRLIGKWLRAGVLTEGRTVHPTTGTPQGGVVSPLLANVYLHEALDRWWIEEVLPRLRGRAVLIRYADDFVIDFAERRDAERVQQVLPRRLGRFGLTLHPDKTRLVPFERPSLRGGGPRPGTFDFLGFTFHWGDVHGELVEAYGLGLVHRQPAVTLRVHDACPRASPWSAASL